MEKKQSAINEISIFALGELVVAALTVGGFLLLDGLGITEFDLTVIFGAALGFIVIVANYTMLALAVNRAVNNFMELRGKREMSDEEAEKFAAENSMPIQNAIKTSFIVRTVSMVATLIIAFLTSWFNPLATAIPMFAFRPLLTLIEGIRKKYDKKPNPDNFIKYEYKDENNDAKESD